MAPHSSTLAWKIPWMEEPGRLQSMGSLAVGHDWATSLSLFTFMHWIRKWQPTPVFLPGESQGRGSLVGSGVFGVSGVAQSRTRLKQLSSSSILIIAFLTGVKWHLIVVLICISPIISDADIISQVSKVHYWPDILGIIYLLNFLVLKSGDLWINT